MLFSKKIEPVALDIGSTFIKLVQLKGSNKNYQLVKFGMVPLPPEVIVEGAVMDAGRVVEAIKELLAAQKVTTKEVVISVSGSSVIIKRVSVADMTDEELAESIKWEAEQYIPFSIDDVNVDFQKLGPGATEGQADVLLVAVKKDKINDYVNLVKEAGLEPVVMDVDAFALANMHELNYEIEDRHNGAFEYRRIGDEHQYPEGWNVNLHTRHHRRRQSVYRSPPEGFRAYL